MYTLTPCAITLAVDYCIILLWFSLLWPRYHGQYCAMSATEYII